MLKYFYNILMVMVGHDIILSSTTVDLLEILATQVQHRFAQANGSSTNTTRVHTFHALLLASKH